MAALLNQIIAIGGTTAHTEPVDAATLRNWMDSDTAHSAWLVAEADGEILGFQEIGPNAKLPPQACDIATFVRPGRTGLGIGSGLFNVTAEIAGVLGFDWINAAIRADNEGGLIYYQSRGFRRYDRQCAVPLPNGLIVDRVLMRYDLR